MLWSRRTIPLWQSIALDVVGGCLIGLPVVLVMKALFWPYGECATGHEHQVFISFLTASLLIALRFFLNHEVGRTRRERPAHGFEVIQRPAPVASKGTSD